MALRLVFPLFIQAFERNAILENELDEKQRLSEMCQRLKDEVRGRHTPTHTHTHTIQQHCSTSLLYIIVLLVYVHVHVHTSLYM